MSWSVFIRRPLPRYAGQNLDRRLCAHQPKTELLENKDPVGTVANAAYAFDFETKEL